MMMKIEVPSEVKGLIFDLDGTLANTMPIHYEAYQKVLDKYGVVFPKDTFHSWAGIPTVQTFEQLKEMFAISDMDPKAATLEKRGNFERKLHLAEVIEPVFNVVKEHYGKLPMSIGTGSSAVMGRKTYETLGIDHYIKILVTIDDVNHPKPHPETFLLCASKMGVDPKDCLVFEDGDNGINAAKSVGMQYIDVRNYVPSEH